MNKKRRRNLSNKYSWHAMYRLFKAGSDFCLSLVPSGPMRVSARTDRLNKQTNKQTNKYNKGEQEKEKTKKEA